MKETKKILNALAITTAVMILSSIWVRPSDSWMWCIPVFLVCICFGQSLKDNK